MVSKEIYCAIPVDSNDNSYLEEDFIETLLSDTDIVYSDCIEGMIDDIKNNCDLYPTDKPIKVKITIEVEQL